jgi:hypothetical protein
VHNTSWHASQDNVRALWIHGLLVDGIRPKNLHSTSSGRQHAVSSPSVASVAAAMPEVPVHVGTLSRNRGERARRMHLMERHRRQLATPLGIPAFSLFMNRCCGEDRLRPEQVHSHGETVMWGQTP